MKWRERVGNMIGSVDTIYVDFGGCLVEISVESADWLMGQVRKSDLSWTIDKDGDLVIEEVSDE